MQKQNFTQKAQMDLTAGQAFAFGLSLRHAQLPTVSHLNNYIFSPIRCCSEE